MTSAVPLLSESETVPFRIVHPHGEGAALIVADHASNIVPEALSSLGLETHVLDTHIAYDIGAAGVAEELAGLLDIPGILSGFSRLVIDINRAPDDFTSIREISDQIVIPGNQHLSGADLKARRDEIFWPYHQQVQSMIEKARHRAALSGVAAPAMISVHSFTDSMKGVQRPWHIGVLYAADDRLGKRVIETLERQNPALTIGDNKPYSGRDAFGFTFEQHAYPLGLPNVLFEIRQDLISDQAGQLEYATLLAKALKEVLQDPVNLTFFTPSGASPIGSKSAG